MPMRIICICDTTRSKWLSHYCGSFDIRQAKVRNQTHPSNIALIFLYLCIFYDGVSWPSIYANKRCTLLFRRRAHFAFRAQFRCICRGSCSIVLFLSCYFFHLGRHNEMSRLASSCREAILGVVWSYYRFVSAEKARCCVALLCITHHSSCYCTYQDNQEDLTPIYKSALLCIINC